jgi:hypothetical protein
MHHEACISTHILDGTTTNTKVAFSQLIMAYDVLLAMLTMYTYMQSNLGVEMGDAVVGVFTVISPASLADGFSMYIIYHL